MRNTAGCQTLCGCFVVIAYTHGGGGCIGKPRMDFPL